MKGPHTPSAQGVLCLRVDVGHFQVSDRDIDSLLGDVHRTSKGEDAGTWYGVEWDTKENKFSGRSTAVFTYRWEAIGWLIRRRAIAEGR